MVVVTVNDSCDDDHSSCGKNDHDGGGDNFEIS